MNRYIRVYNDNILKQEYAKLIQQFDWSWLVTLTFRKTVTQHVAQKRLESYLDSLSAVSSGLWVFWVIEGGSETGRTHCHALVANPGGLEAQCRSVSSECAGCAFHKWKHGFVRITRYDPTLTGSYYVSKQIGADWAAWDFWGKPPQRTVLLQAA